MKHGFTRLLAVVLTLVLLLSMLPAVSAAGVQTNEEKLIQALVDAVEPTNKILASRVYNPIPIATLSFDPDALQADVMILDTEKRAIKMLEVPFLKELFSYSEIYALQVGEDLIEYESLNQFNIMLAVGHNTIGQGMGLEAYYVWLKSLADTLTISTMDGHDVNITVICRTDPDDEDTEYSATINLRIYNRFHKITWKFNNGEEDYVREKVEVGASIARPNPTPPAGMKFLRWDPEVPAKMGTTDLEFNAIWIPTDHAGYEVRHRLQTLDLTGYELVETEYLSGKIGSSVVGSDKAKTFEGFKLNNLPDNTKTYVITEDGNTKINLYYDRINIKITWDWGFKKLSRSVKYGLMPEAPDMPTPPDDGREYIFVRWDKEIVPATEPTTYRARYADDKMLVLTLNAAGGTVSTAALYLYIGDTFAALPTPTREGYTFLGWFYEDDTPVDPARVVEEEGEETVVAHWKINQYSIYFDTDGGNEIEPITLDYGAVITPPADPVKEGCAFLGWSPLLPYTMPAKTLFVTAQWHIHNIVIDPAVPATCTASGLTAGEHCISCDYKVEQIVVPALGHDYQPGTVVTPSCVEDGYTVYVCTRCNATENRDPVAAPGHNWNDGVVTTPATATTDGVKTFTCLRCGATRTEVIPATGGGTCQHAASHAEHKDATCTEAGYDKTVCDDCGAVLSETVIPALGHDYRNYPAQAATCTAAGWNAYHECTRCHDTDYKEIPALGHDYQNHAAKPATCTEPGWGAYQTCSRCDYSTYNEIAALGHDIVADAAVPATCTASGLTAGEHCTRCDYKIAQEVVPALGHDYIVTAATEPTCTAGGSATYTCSRCANSYTETFAKLGHDFKVTVVEPTCTEKGYTFYECRREGCGYTEKGNWTDALGHGHVYPEHKDPTCTEPGYDRQICDDCGAVVSETVIPALGHELVTDPAKAATCTETGLTEGKHCTRCDYKVAQEVVPALGHAWDEGKVTKPATATAKGEKTFTCTRCGATRTEDIPATGGGSNPFKDIKTSDYFYNAVLWAAENGVTTGTSATTFSPNATCTRGQVVTFLWRSSGCPEPKSTNNPFKDVKATDYFYKAVLWAAENGVTTGTSATTFSPNAPCTRAHVVTFLWRAQGEPTPANTNNPFKDVTAGQYYTTAVLWAVSHEPQITNGTGATTFSPNNPCTRGQIVTFLYRAMAD
ncbi:MAG: S-layer homology domain-containing protein [Oscillospiraceae bacterium]|nr:S-layer homology domain-containing protein [Oscillospiraceae bacterium]